MVPELMDEFHFSNSFKINKFKKKKISLPLLPPNLKIPHLHHHSYTRRWCCFDKLRHRCCHFQQTPPHHNNLPYGGWIFGGGPKWNSGINSSPFRSKNHYLIIILVKLTFLALILTTILTVGPICHERESWRTILVIKKLIGGPKWNLSISSGTISLNKTFVF